MWTGQTADGTSGTIRWAFPLPPRFSACSRARRHRGRAVPAGSGRADSPADPHEQEADRVARAVVGPEPGAPGAAVLRSAAGSPGPRRRSGRRRWATSARASRFPATSGPSWNRGSAATSAMCAFIAARRRSRPRGPRGGRVHVRAGHLLRPGPRTVADALTAHELSHVVQQRPRPGRWRRSASSRASPAATRWAGAFEIDMQTKEGGSEHPSDPQRLRRLHPLRPEPGRAELEHDRDDPDRQADRPRGSRRRSRPLPPGTGAARRPRRSGLRNGRTMRRRESRAATSRTSTTVGTSGCPPHPQGSGLSPRFNFQPAPGGAAGVAGTTQQPAQYGGGTGGVVGQTPGFKRSNEPADIKSAALFDTPGIAEQGRRTSTSRSSRWPGARTRWSPTAPSSGASASAAGGCQRAPEHGRRRLCHLREGARAAPRLLRPRAGDVYFPFDSDTLEAPESAKIDTFHDYLTRNPTSASRSRGSQTSAAAPASTTGTSPATGPRRSPPS